MKLSPEQKILNFILYLKHNNSTLFDTYLWNYSKSAVSDGTILIASCMNEALCDEIEWPSEEERVELGQRFDEFPGCIGLFDGTLVKVRRPWKDKKHGRFFKGRKKCIV